MKTFKLEDNIIVHCITASSFPDGIQKAHQTLHSMVPFNESRKYFGLSWPDQNSNIIYKAAVEELVKGELSNKQLETITIEKGDYLYTDIPDFMKNTPAIGKAFQEMIRSEHVAPNGFCIEWYLSTDVCRCMIRKK